MFSEAAGSRAKLLHGTGPSVRVRPRSTTTTGSHLARRHLARPKLARKRQQKDEATVTTYNFHPLADLFPLLDGADFDELVADVLAHGMCEAIVLYEGKILDGRNRYRACIAAGIEPSFVNYEDIAGRHDPLTFIVSVNLKRRHLTAKQKRDLVEKLLKAKPEVSNNAIATQVKVDDKTVAKLRRGMEARSEIPNVTSRTDTRGRKQPAKKSTKKPEAKQPVRKPVKHDDRIISPELGERVGHLAYRLIRLDINLARELADLILQRGVAERLWNDLDTGIEIEGSDADPETSAEARKAKFTALDDGADPKGRAF
jgi:hypothetical protein